MKNLTLFIIFLCIARLATAQTRATDLSQTPLKGKVKQVITYVFRGENHTVPDTTKIAEKTIETFDEKGWPLEEKIYDKNDALQERFSFEYIGDSIVVKKQFDAGGKLFVKYVFKYDGQGKETEFDMNSDAQPQMRLAKINYRCIYKYDKLGNRISEEQYIDDDKLTMKTISRYNDQHQRIESDEEQFFGKTFKKSKIIFTYDNVGNPIKSAIYDADGHLTGGNDASCDKVDKYGNWLITTSSYSGHSSYQGDFTFMNITKREITYY